MWIYYRKRGGEIIAFFFLALLFFVIPCMAGRMDVKSKDGPSIVILQPTFNAGKVTEGDVVVHTFMIQNKGTQTLVIKNVKPG